MASISADTFKPPELHIHYKSGLRFMIMFERGKRAWWVNIYRGQIEDGTCMRNRPSRYIADMPEKIALALYHAAMRDNLLDEDLPDYPIEDVP